MFLRVVLERECNDSRSLSLLESMSWDLAWCDMDFQQLAREFIYENEHWADYMKQFLLDKENFKNFTEKVEDMHLTNYK
ncbi:hypothetical protein NPIL_420051 [Nephila pilipes]|uniref:Uncharacterized protein n=1 Tax=Nephila pilipes TaxID=299642 RepID=A0A8X6ITE5_NEPPI|nr:hypothetical protein NPIL_420051 [Nephila pilipes]